MSLAERPGAIENTSSLFFGLWLVSGVYILLPFTKNCLNIGPNPWSQRVWQHFVGTVLCNYSGKPSQDSPQE